MNTDTLNELVHVSTVSEVAAQHEIGGPWTHGTNNTTALRTKSQWTFI